LYEPITAGDAQESLVAADNMRLVTPPLQAAGKPSTPPIAYADFVAELAPVLAGSRDHQLTAPAGRPVIVPLRAVPLQPSPMEQRRRAEKGAGHAGAPPPRGLDAARPIAPTTQPSTKGQEVPQ
jgi:hypothetical protein